MIQARKDAQAAAEQAKQEAAAASAQRQAEAAAEALEWLTYQELKGPLAVLPEASVLSSPFVLTD